MKIQRIEIEPADDGGFMVIVQHKAPKCKCEKGEPCGCHQDYDSLRRKSVFNNPAALGNHIKGLFPSNESVQKEGKETSHHSGGSRLDTYES